MSEYWFQDIVIENELWMDVIVCIILLECPPRGIMNYRARESALGVPSEEVSSADVPSVTWIARRHKTMLALHGFAQNNRVPVSIITIRSLSNLLVGVCLFDRS
jgi:hypothetical protein